MWALDISQLEFLPKIGFTGVVICIKAAAAAGCTACKGMIGVSGPSGLIPGTFKFVATKFSACGIAAGNGADG